MKTLTPRQELNAANKRLAIDNEKKNQRPIKSLTISIEWRKSRTWGMNPYASVNVEYLTGEDRHIRDEGFTASGCGYDKESTVIAAIFNKYLAYKLYLPLKGDAPYGMRNSDYKYYEGGVGTGCYKLISEFIGGKFETVANGKTFSVFKYTDNKRVK